MRKTDEIYTTIDSMEVNVSESFVRPQNKRKGAGNGESRLYVGSQKTSVYGSFIIFDAKNKINTKTKSYDACSCTCMLDKDNLIEYMQAVQDEYLSPTVDYQGDLPNLYGQRLAKIQQLPPISRFIVFDQNGNTDSERLYLGSQSHNWELIREIALPFISIIRIEKIYNESNGEMLYIFTLHRSEENATNISVENGQHHNSTNAYQRKHEIKMHEIDSNLSLSDTDKKQIITARKGQGKFRDNTLALMPACPFTGIHDPRFLRVSHCIPWAECTTASDRLDGYNGLTLTPTYDLLYDQGFISFTSDGTLHISKYLSDEIIQTLNLIDGKKYIDNDSQLRTRFLDYHYHNIFKYN